MNLLNFYKKLNAKYCAFIAVLFWSTAFVFTKSILKYMDVNTLAVARYFFAGIIMIFVALKKKMSLPKMEDIPYFFLAGFFGYSGYLIVFNIALSKISPSSASVISALAPAITAIIAYFLFKEKIKFIAWIALLISFIGILILTLWDGVFSINVGLIYMFLACLCISFYNISQRGLSQKYSSLEVTIYSMLTGTIQLSLYSPTSYIKIFSMNMEVILMILYMAIFPSILSYLMWTRAFEIASSTAEVTSFMFAIPVLATIMGIIFLGDIPKLSTFIGGGIIILGIFIFNKTKN